MNKLMILILTLALSTCVKATTPEFSQLFKKFHACFILYHVNENKIVSEYNPNNYCNKRIAPNSTFKIPLSLMAFDQGIINQNTVFKWDGKQRELTDWNQDLTPHTWLKYSSVLISQQLAAQIGEKRIKQYLADFKYGNQDFTGDPGKHNGLTHAWLSSSLKISANEQLNFLKTMIVNELKVSKSAVTNTYKNLYLGKLDNGANYYGKTGSGRNGRNERLSNPSKLRDGWFVGFIENGKERYIFVSNLTDIEPASKDKSYGKDALKPYGSQIVKPIALKLLNDYFTRVKK